MVFGNRKSFVWTIHILPCSKVQVPGPGRSRHIVTTILNPQLLLHGELNSPPTDFLPKDISIRVLRSCPRHYKACKSQDEKSLDCEMIGCRDSEHCHSPHFSLTQVHHLKERQDTWQKFKPGLSTRDSLLFITTLGSRGYLLGFLHRVRKDQTIAIPKITLSSNLWWSRIAQNLIFTIANRF